MIEISQEKFMSILSENDIKDNFVPNKITPESKNLESVLREYIKLDQHPNKCILGIDIFQYSLYESFQQELIPLVFKMLKAETIRILINYEQYLFQKCDEVSFNSNFVDTGDGGFQIFDTPIHAVIFASTFETVVRSFNGYSLYPNLRSLFKSQIVFRYAITFDRLFRIDNNFYGQSIINCSRIMSKDKLNRCLIDSNTNEWFISNLQGIENLRIVSVNYLTHISEFFGYTNNGEFKNGLIRSKIEPDSNLSTGIVRVDISKIDRIVSKNVHLDIYNVHIQSTVLLVDETDVRKYHPFTVSLGNLNTSGLV